ncbi:hypothetical protein L596_022382 [Steinernema carpocapsae]|uniref:Uncharacterized protein n=1 Tax=Steinernema carpocapsae TaxID=34508 RepID=A0A4U5MME1_STECR|nr:hypothetical protein L596_022382 [Steinernema carpocapsae]
MLTHSTSSSAYSNRRLYDDMEFVCYEFADSVVAHLSNPLLLRNLRSLVWSNAAQLQYNYRGNAELSVLFPTDLGGFLQAFGERSFLKDRKNKNNPVEARIWAWKKRQLLGLSLDRIAIHGRPEEKTEAKWQYSKVTKTDVLRYLEIPRREWAFPSNLEISNIQDDHLYANEIIRKLPVDFQIYNFHNVHGQSDAFVAFLQKLANSPVKNLKINFTSCSLTQEATDAIIYLLRPNCKTTIQFKQQDLSFFGEAYLNLFYNVWYHEENVQALMRLHKIDQDVAELLTNVLWNRQPHPKEGDQSTRFSVVETHQFLGAQRKSLVEVKLG